MFRDMVDEAINKYMETGGTRENVIISLVIMSDGVTPPTSAIASMDFSLEKPGK